MIIDSHVHFIDPTRPQGAPYPDPQQESRLYRTVLPHHFKAITAHLGVTGVVVVEASHWVEDNQWILDLAADEPLIVGFSGNLDMREDSFEDHVNRFAANPLFRGIRPRSLDNADFSTPAVLRAAEVLAGKDLQLDVNLGYYDMEHLLHLAGAVPQLRIVINHIGAGRPIDGIAANPEWAGVMRRMARRPNVFCKVSAVLQHSAVLPRSGRRGFLQAYPRCALGRVRRGPPPLRQQLAQRRADRPLLPGAGHIVRVLPGEGQ